jgi:hypothetical protein
MNMLNEWVWLGLQWVNAIAHLWVHPFYYIALLLIFLQYRRQVKFERLCFNTRLHSAIHETWSSVLWGLIAGMGASVILLSMGVVIRPFDLFWIWGITLLLSLLRVRYLCMAYAVGIIGILREAAIWIPLEDIGNTVWVESLKQIHMPSLLALVGLLHLIEAFLVNRQGAQSAMPIFIEGRRGRIIGGYQLQRFWPIPLFLWIPVSTPSAIPWENVLSGWGWPWLAGGILLQSLSMFLFPAVVGYGERTISQYPDQQAKGAAKLLVLYGVMIIGMAVLAEKFPILSIIGALLAIALHEGMILYLQNKDQTRVPLYVHDQRGLMVLAVIPESPAQAMGILPGEILCKVNGMQVTTKEDLYKALQRNSVYCKLELLNRAGHLKLSSRSLFDGEHHELGIILAPDQQARYAMKLEPSRWFGLGKKSTQKPETGYEDAHVIKG